MLAIVSPAKTLDFDARQKCVQFTQPRFLDQSQQLIRQLRKLTPAQLAGLMDISDALAQLNTARFAQWQLPFTLENARQAILAFKGDVYVGLAVEKFLAKDLAFAQQHLLILSGLYGLLRPLDLMQPYRLEMGTGLVNAKGKDLYAFWGGQLTEAINTQLEETRSACLVNLASNEYFKAIQPKKIARPIITPVFKDEKNGQFKVISFFAKKARGLMAAYLIQQRIKEPEAVKQFSAAGYQFNTKLSTKTEWVFCRAESLAEK